MAEVLIQGKVYRHDFGIAVLLQGWNTWVPAAGSLPVVATYGLSIDSKTRVLYAAIPGAAVLGCWIY